MTPKWSTFGSVSDASLLLCRPYLIDIGSTNGTFINSERIEVARYFELKEKVHAGSIHVMLLPSTILHLCCYMI